MSDERTIEVPAPTHFPLIAALGVTLLLAGLVTHVVVSATGIALLFVGAVGWFREVLPTEHVETVSVEAEVPVAVARAGVLRLKAGEAGHRVRYPEEIYPYSAGVKGGVAGGIVMAILACAYGWLAHDSIWYPVNLLAAAASATLSGAGYADLAAFSREGLVLGILIHGTLSLLVGLLYGLLLPMFPYYPAKPSPATQMRRPRIGHLTTLRATPALWHPLLIGGVAVPLVWTGLSWPLLRIINPTLASSLDWPWFVASQIGFGVAAGLVVMRTERIGTMQHLPLAQRAGVEAPGVSEPKDE